MLLLLLDIMLIFIYGNILIHRNRLSKRIDDPYNQKFPYIDPKRFNRWRNKTQFVCTKNVYSVGVLLWEISSCRPPEGEQYDIDLAIEIHKVTDYVKVYTGKCIF